MQRKFYSVAILAAIVILTVLLAASGSVQASPPPPNYFPIDMGPELREWEITPDRIKRGTINFRPEEIMALEAEAMTSAASMPFNECILEQVPKIWMSLDAYGVPGGYFPDAFFLVGETEDSELWIQADLSWPAGDPRPTPVITCDQIAYLLNEFDTKMYPTETSLFGPPDFHDGSFSWLVANGYAPPGYYNNASGRHVILVSNIRDENYYHPTYPGFIAGFYSPVLEGFFDRNVMSIDAYNWENLLGQGSGQPYSIEGVFAHEYQHLLHDDYDPNEELWINEGLSMLTMFLLDYVADNDEGSLIKYKPENSLVVWGDQGEDELFADYEIAFIYLAYLYEHFGESYINAVFHNPLNGISSVNASLSDLGFTQTFEEIYHDVSVAMLIDSEMDDYKYGLEALDIGIDVGHQGNRNPEAYDTPGAPPWGTDYYLLWGYESLAEFEFNGVRFHPLAWTSDGDVLWSGSGDALDNWAIFSATGGGTLNFDASWAIEDYWDFGFIQVSTDGGANWTGLANAYTTSLHDPEADPGIVANLPGLTGSSCAIESDCWVNMSFDLSPYAGQDILVAFRYMTDSVVAFEGWYIENVTVDDTLISDGSSTDGFKGLLEVLDIQNKYTITLVAERNRKGEPVYEVQTILSDNYIGSFEDFKGFFDNYRTVVMLVTYDAPEGVTQYADYSYEFINGGGKPFKKK